MSLHLGYAHSLDPVGVKGHDGSALTPLSTEAALRLSAVLEAAAEQGFSIAVSRPSSAGMLPGQAEIEASFDESRRTIIVPSLALDGSGYPRTGDVADAQLETYRAVADAVQSDQVRPPIPHLGPDPDPERVADLRADASDEFASRCVYGLYSVDVIAEMMDAAATRPGSSPVADGHDGGLDVVDRPDAPVPDRPDPDVASELATAVDDSLSPVAGRVLAHYRGSPELADLAPYSLEAHRGPRVASRADLAPDTPGVLLVQERRSFPSRELAPAVGASSPAGDQDRGRFTAEPSVEDVPSPSPSTSPGLGSSSEAVDSAFEAAHRSLSGFPLTRGEPAGVGVDRPLPQSGEPSRELPSRNRASVTR